METIHVQVDSNIYKNGLMVTIPGTAEKGLITTATFGFIAGDTRKGFRVIEGLTNEDRIKARRLMELKKIELSLKRDSKGLDIKVKLITDQERVRVIILNSHLNIVSVEKIDKNNHFKPFIRKDLEVNSSNKKIQKYALEDFLQFIDETPLEELEFLEDGVKMNLKIALEGLTIKFGIGTKLTEMINKRIMSDNIITQAQGLCAAASEARISGSKFPVMSTAGSGNHGITAFLTNYAVAEKQKFPKKN